MSCYEICMYQVLTRKGQLEGLYVSQEEVERRRREVEAWLVRTEAWRDRMLPVSCHLLESQVREQKVGKKKKRNKISSSWYFRHFTQKSISTKPG